MNRIVTRMWLLAGLMTTTTLVVGIASFYVASYYELFHTRASMPPHIRAELDHLVATGQRGSERYYQLFDRYTGGDVQSSDLPFLVIIAGISTIIGGSAAYLFARRLSRPITEVARAAVLVASGDRNARVDERNAAGETGELVRSFNRMASDIEAFERERTVLTAGIAHELRTPLTILRGRLHAIQDGVIEPATGEAGRLLRHVDALGRLVEDLRTLAHADAGELQLDLRVVDMADIAGTVAADLKAQAEPLEVAIALRLRPAPVRGDPLRLAQIITNLLTNAIKHAPAGTTVEVVSATERGGAYVRVLDLGPGFRDEDRSRLFMPFWRAGGTNASVRPGSGMGLALAAKLAEAQGGRIVAENREDAGGACFTINLPAFKSRKSRS